MLKELRCLLAIIRAQTSAQADRIAFLLEFKNEIEQKHDRKTVDSLSAGGINFDASMGAEVLAADSAAAP